MPRQLPIVPISTFTWYLGNVNESRPVEVLKERRHIVVQRNGPGAPQFARILPALCVLLLQRCLSFLDVLLQGCQPALPLLLALLTKQLTRHPFQGKDANSLRAHAHTHKYSKSHMDSLCRPIPDEFLIMLVCGDEPIMEALPQ